MKRNVFMFICMLHLRMVKKNEHVGGTEYSCGHIVQSSRHNYPLCKHFRHHNLSVLDKVFHLHIY